jgi:hypothetical protein
MHGVERGREGGGHGEKWLGWPALAPGRWTREARTRVAGRRDRATAGPSGQRRGAVRARRHGAADRRARQHSACGLTRFKN